MNWGMKAERPYRIGGLAYIMEVENRYYNLMGRKVDFKKVGENIRKLMKNEKIRKHLSERVSVISASPARIQPYAPLTSSSPCDLF
jgi:hypothetical protein